MFDLMSWDLGIKRWKWCWDIKTVLFERKRNKNDSLKWSSFDCAENRFYFFQKDSFHFMSIMVWRRDKVIKHNRKFLEENLLKFVVFVFEGLNCEHINNGELQEASSLHFACRKYPTSSIVLIFKTYVSKNFTCIVLV